MRFHTRIEPALAGTPLTVDLITGPDHRARVPGNRRHLVEIEQEAAECMGDTLGSDKGRRAFRRTKTARMGRSRDARPDACDTLEGIVKWLMMRCSAEERKVLEATLN